MCPLLPVFTKTTGAMTTMIFTMKMITVSMTIVVITVTNVMLAAKLMKNY